MVIKTTKNERIAMSAYLNSVPDDLNYDQVLYLIETEQVHKDLDKVLGCEDWHNMYLIECIEALKDTLERAYK